MTRHGFRGEPRDDGDWLVYADWLEEHGLDGEAQDIRERVADHPPQMWAYEYRFGVVGGSAGVGGFGAVGGFGGAGAGVGVGG